jgi:hypothetical protein
MNIDSFENNPNCLEPVNAQYIQRDGVPVGFTPTAQTLQMKQGDKVEITINDTPAGLLNQVQDETTGKSGFMVASAANGFFHTDPATCAMTPFSFHPEYATARFGNFVPWAVLQANVGFSIETGHFTPGVSGDGDADDAPCFAGPVVPGCTNDVQSGDLDFDGTSYLPDWPDGTSNTATSLRITSDLDNGIGPLSSPDGTNDFEHPYSKLMFESTVLGSEGNACCSIPPAGAPFYPFYTQARFAGLCVLTFGNDIKGATVNDFGGDAQYGSQNLAWSPELASSGVQANPCIPH